MMTLIVLAALIAAPLLFGVLLAVGLGSFMALYFAFKWMQGLAQATGPGPAASKA